MQATGAKPTAAHTGIEVSFKQKHLHCLSLPLPFIDLPLPFIDLPLPFIDLPLPFSDLPLPFTATAFH